jgi:hypothetical protein
MCKNIFFSKTKKKLTKNQKIYKKRLKKIIKTQTHAIFAKEVLYLSFSPL